MVQGLTPWLNRPEDQEGNDLEGGGEKDGHNRHVSAPHGEAGQKQPFSVPADIGDDNCSGAKDGEDGSMEENAWAPATEPYDTPKHQPSQECGSGGGPNHGPGRKPKHVPTYFQGR